MKYKYVVIEREYGSGGTQIGRLLSEKADIPCCGTEILSDVSQKLQIPVSEIERYEESISGSFLYSLYALGRINDGSGDMLSKEDKIFIEEQRLIKEYALCGPSIFIGRCAEKALQGQSVLNVFIHADEEFRKKRIAEEYGIAEKQISGAMAKFDKKRRNFYYANTGRKWNDHSNYHIVLDSSKLGIERCADIIHAALK